MERGGCCAATSLDSGIASAPTHGCRILTFPNRCPANRPGRLPVSSKPGTSKLGALTLGALGVVYGDIGTSPLYVMKTVFDPAYGLSLNPANLVGIVSLIFWSLMVVVTLKYVTLIMRADNHGEGGIMALLALAASSVADKPKLRHVLLMTGVFVPRCSMATA